jgi:hypothetical protein
MVLAGAKVVQIRHSCAKGAQPRVSRAFMHGLRLKRSGSGGFEIAGVAGTPDEAQRAAKQRRRAVEAGGLRHLRMIVR